MYSLFQVMVFVLLSLQLAPAQCWRGWQSGSKVLLSYADRIQNKEGGMVPTCLALVIHGARVTSVIKDLAFFFF